jgi:hypothetical protein
MELKVVCNCGQKYTFDVNPVGNRMPFAIACPSCGADGTAAANAQLSHLPVAPPAGPPTLSLSAAAPVAMVAAPPPIAAIPAARPAPIQIPKVPAKTKGAYNLGLGILGACIGSVVGGGIMYFLSYKLGFRFPLLGCAIGFATGGIAKLMAKGEDSALGAVSAGLAVVATAATLWMIYGEFPIICIISVVVSASVAFRTAS